MAGFTVADAGSRRLLDTGNSALQHADNGNPTASGENGNAPDGNGGAAADTGDARGNDQVCDATADYFLGAEDHREAVAAHQRVLGAHPGDALAYYHLGFAFGMTGDRIDEIADYRRAAAARAASIEALPQPRPRPTRISRLWRSVQRIDHRRGAGSGTSGKPLQPGPGL